MKRRRVGLLCLLVTGLVACQMAPEPEPLPPPLYLDSALSWIEAHAIAVDDATWPAIRAEAEDRIDAPQTTADTYPAIDHALTALGDTLAWLYTSSERVIQHQGLLVLYPERIVVDVYAGSPAASAGIVPGDVIATINGRTLGPGSVPRQADLAEALPGSPGLATVTLERQGTHETVEIALSDYEHAGSPVGRPLDLGEHALGYVELPWDVGTEMYATRAHAALAAADGRTNCGWIVDLRRNAGGNLWSYLAALSPILGEGEVGGFVYPDGRDEAWTLRAGVVSWGDDVREHESYVRGRRHQVQTPGLPVALLIGPLTHAAPELVVMAFRGYGPTRTFGEPTGGAPHLVLHTPLSDGALLYAAGAVGRDRSGVMQHGPIAPDEPIAIAWDRLGTEDDPVIDGAVAWLLQQPACR